MSKHEIIFAARVDIQGDRLVISAPLSPGLSFYNETTTGSIGIGLNSLQGLNSVPATTTGVRNTGYGTRTLSSLTSGSDDAMVGYDTGRALTTGARDTFSGSLAGDAATTANDTTLYGYAAGSAITTALNNTIAGSGAGAALTNQPGNTIVGRGACATGTPTTAVIIGDQAGAAATGTSPVIIGNMAGTTSLGTNTVIIGPGAGTSANCADGVIIGNGAGTGATAPRAIIIGNVAGLTTAGSGHVIIGNQAGSAISGANSACVLIGEHAGQNWPGSANGQIVCIGNRAGQNMNNAVFQDVYIGPGAGLANVSGVSNTYTGAFAGTTAASGDSSCLYGRNTLVLANPISASVAMGALAGSNTTAATNLVIIGESAGTGNTTGTGHIIIGKSAGTTAPTTGNNVINIGGGVGVAGDANLLRLASGALKNFTGGIRGITTDIADAVAVLVDSGGQLGTVSSNEFLKEGFQDVGEEEARRLVHSLPVRYFRYLDSSVQHIGVNVEDFSEELRRIYPKIVSNDEAIATHDLQWFILKDLQRIERELCLLKKEMPTYQPNYDLKMDVEERKVALEKYHSKKRKRVEDYEHDMEEGGKKLKIDL